MTNNRVVEISVGIFMLLGVLALMILALQVSGLTRNIIGNNSYTVTAVFDNIGDLKPRAPVTISGVRIGQVESIQLNPQTYQAEVVLRIDKRYQDIPVDSTARIFTQGLLGSNYISLDPGFQNQFLVNGGKLANTRSALILENLIGQLMFKLTGSDGTGSKK